MRKSVKILEISIAVLLVFVPLILKTLDGTWRTSISDYAYSEFSNVFVFLLSLAGTMLLYNGVGNKRHWYNVFLGIALIVVSLTPYKEYPTAHFAFAGLFFLGSILAISLSSNVFFKTFKYILSMAVSTALLLHFQFNVFSLLVAEWIGIIPITSHFIIKSLNFKQKTI